MEYLVSEKIKTNPSYLDHDQNTNEQIIEKINKSMRLGKWKLEHANWRYSFYIILLILLILIFIHTITNNR